MKRDLFKPDYLLKSTESATRLDTIYGY